MTEKRAKRKFTDQFKQQMVKLHNSGKPRAEIIKEYDLTPSIIGFAELMQLALQRKVIIGALKLKNY